jgi:hypothetical protein
MNHRSPYISVFSTLFLLSACSSSPGDGGPGQSYDFEAVADAKISLNVLELLSALFSPRQSSRVMAASTPPSLCTSVVCFTPTRLTGKHFGMGLLIQSSGNGMSAYFGAEEWASITGASDKYDFDASSPVTNSGNLTCCNGTGDLSSENTYISEVTYLFGYVDATFTVSGVTGNEAMNTTYTLRFVMADGAIVGGLRGDVLMRVDDSGNSCPVTSTSCTGVFKWMDSTENFSETRPTSPVVMNASVVNYDAPFDEGQQNIPVFGVPVLPASGDGVLQVTEAELRAAGNTYDFKFDPNGFVMFPAVLTSDINLISSKKALMERVHLAGLPHSAQSMGVGNPASTVLEITPAADSGSEE